MPHRLKLASAIVLLLAAAAAQACGHLPFDDLPDLDASAAPDGDGVAPVVDSGGGGADRFIGEGGPDAVADGGIDARIPDAAPPDAACVTTGDCHVIYVSEGLGDDELAGTSDRPVKTIQQGLRLVTSTRNELHVASGSYVGPITLKQDVRLFGGFLCKNENKCTWGPDPGNPSIIAAQDSALGALVITRGLTRATIIQDFTIQGANGDLDPGNLVGAFTVSILRSSPVLRNLNIEGGKTTGGPALGSRSTAVLVHGRNDADKGGVLFDKCTIKGGPSEGESAGIRVEDGPTALVNDPSPAIQITNGTGVVGGSAPRSYGVLLHMAGEGTVIRDSFLQALPSSSSGEIDAPESQSWALVVNGTADILDNRINQAPSNGTPFCRTPKVFCGGLLTNNAVTNIHNNVIGGLFTANSAAVLLGTSDAKPIGSVNLNGNVLLARGMLDGSAIGAAIVLKNSNATKSILGEVRNDILVANEAKTNYAVYELETNTAEAHLLAFDHNDVRAGVAYRFFAPPSTIKDYALGSAGLGILIPTVDANITEDCKLDATFHLTAGSPCINAGTEVKAPLVDFDGDKRPITDKFDIGADESTPP